MALDESKYFQPKYFLLRYSDNLYDFSEAHSEQDLEEIVQIDRTTFIDDSVIIDKKLI